ncbi:MAG TPA: trigger factor [Saprospiraceae bacterium]|nr:trigger factor [Saprospiraceae bacterium]
MSQVVREDIDNLNAVLTVTIAQDEYEPKFKQQLKKYRDQAQIKGFRKGKTPNSVLKKMFGKNILVEIVNEMIQEKLVGYLQEEELNLLGQPLPSDDQDEVDFDLKNLQDYIFKFDVGLAPDFEIQGLDENNSFEKHKVIPREEDITSDLENARKRMGEMIHSEDKIGEEDLVKFKAAELEGDHPKDSGVEAEFSVPVEKMTDAAKKKVLAAKVGDVFQYQLDEIEAEIDADYVKKYYLNLEDEAAEALTDLNFQLTIIDATHVEPAELNEEFFQKVFGNEEIKTEEQARAEIAKNIEQYYNNQADALLYRDFQERLLDMNDLQLPGDFLKRWILSSNENATPEGVDAEFDAFTKNLQWSLITEKIAKANDLQVSQEELMAGLKNRVMGYLQGNPGLGDEFVEMMVGRLMQDEQQVRQVQDEIMAEKLHDAIAEQVTIEPKEISADDFEAVLKEAQESAQAAQQPANNEEE